MNRQRIQNLVYHDFRTFGKQILQYSFFILMIGMAITFINTNTLMVFSGGVGNIIMVVIAAFALEHTNNAIRMHTASLPVTRREIVAARYLSALIIVVANTILHFVLFNALESYIDPNPTYTSLWQFGSGLMFGLVQLSLFFILFYRVHLLVAVIIFVLPTTAWRTISPNKEFMMGLVPESSGELLIYLSITIATLAFSYFHTASYFSKKNL